MLSCLQTRQNEAPRFPVTNQNCENPNGPAVLSGGFNIFKSDRSQTWPEENLWTVMFPEVRVSEFVIPQEMFHGRYFQVCAGASLVGHGTRDHAWVWLSGLTISGQKRLWSIILKGCGLGFCCQFLQVNVNA